MSSNEDLLDNNERYARSFDKGDLSARPARQLAVVTCMDARIDVHRILGIGEGDAHVIRNAGGVVTDDVLRSLLISQRLLGTEEVLVIHHTECGMLGIDEPSVAGEIERETGRRLPFALRGFTDVEEDVRASVAAIRESQFLPATGNVGGFVYDVRTGALKAIE